MARKLPPPPLQQQASSERTSNPRDRPMQQTQTQEHASRMQDIGNPLSRHDSNSSYGAVPRSPSYRSVMQNQYCPPRRGLDGLNLESPMLPSQSSPSSQPENLFDFTLTDPRPGSLEVTAIEGQELYLHFFHEQLRSAHLGEFAAQEEARLADYHLPEVHIHAEAVQERRRHRHTSLNLENFQNPIWRETGRELQTLADAFANSSERILVRERALQVDVANITKEKLLAMLQELFQGGQVTRERILVLFFFCSDIAIIAVRSRISGLLSELTRWSLSFIRDQVCSWVHQNGGWRSVLSSGLNFVQQAAVIGMCAAVITCCFIYIRKNLS